MEKQISFAQAEFAGKKRITRREKFLGDMEKVMPWGRLVGVVEPHYPRGERGRPPVGIERMLRIYFLQQWYALSDEALEDAIYDSQAMRSFAGIDLSVEAVPDATTLLNFRHLLEKHGLTKAIFEQVGAMLEEKKLLMREGTIVDATIIAAPSSTKNQSKERDPQMHQTKKGNQWYFGMKAHVGADAGSGLIHTVIGTPANVADVKCAPALLHGEEKRATAMRVTWRISLCLIQSPEFYQPKTFNERKAAMWLMTQYGFYSIVQHKDDSEKFLVRARVRLDLDRLKDLAALTTEIVELKDADYRYRIEISRNEMLRVLKLLGDAINYPNFKDRIADLPDQKPRLSQYHDVWATMRGMSETQ